MNLTEESREAKKYLKDRNLKLPTRFKERWLDSLESGEYKKGKDALCTGNANHDFCCLGVAGRIQGIPVSKMIDVSFLNKDIINLAKKNKKNIPEVLQERNPVTEYLSILNDSTSTFTKVRSWIKKNL